MENRNSTHLPASNPGMDAPGADSKRLEALERQDPSLTIALAAVVTRYAQGVAAR